MVVCEDNYGKVMHELALAYGPDHLHVCYLKWSCKIQFIHENTIEVVIKV